MKHYLLRAIKVCVTAITVVGMGFLSSIPAQAQDGSAQNLVTSINVPNKMVGDLYREGVALSDDGRWAAARLKWQAAANMGNPASTGMLGQLYLKGVGVEQDVVRGVALIQRGISLGDDLSKYYLGEAYLRGEGVETNVPLAIDLMTQGLGEAPAADVLLAAAKIHHDRSEQAASEHEKRRHLTHATLALHQILGDDTYGDAARGLLMGYYGAPNSVLQSFDDLKLLALPAAEEGNAQAAYWMAFWHIYNQSNGGTAQDARAWMQRAVDGEYVNAYGILALFVSRGFGGPQNQEEACRLTARAIELNSPLSDPNMAQACGLSQ